MKVILAGGSGFIGTSLIQKLGDANCQVVLLTRKPPSRKFPPHVIARQWDAKSPGSWATDVEGSDAVINLAGESLAGKRWTDSQKETILKSRVESTRALVEAIRNAKQKPSVLINASGVGFYGSVENGRVTEGHEKGAGFLADVCELWEAEAKKATESGVRVVLMRNSVVLGRDGGALPKMALPYKLFAGAPLGSGRQWFPWIHLDDAVGLFLHAIENKNLSGPLNVSAPDSKTMKEFCDQLGRTLHRPSWPPVPGFVLRLALGEMSEMLLTGQNAVPAKALDTGYVFRFSKLDDALAEIFS